jgi:Arc/MetJ-type ribon-helix-helix transcriptional regulator
LERDERAYEAKLFALRNAIDEGDASGVMDGNPFDQIRAAMQRAVKPA